MDRQRTEGAEQKPDGHVGLNDGRQTHGPTNGGKATAAPKRPRGRPRSVDQDAVLGAVMDVFWRKGFDGASLDELTAAAGVSRPTLYGLFGDKEATFLAALDAYAAGIGSRPVAAFDAEVGIQEAVRAFLAASVENGTMSDRPSGCLIGCVAVPCAATMPTARDHVRAAFDGTRAHLAERFAGEVQTGRLAPEPTPEQRAHMMVDLMNAQALRARGGATREELMADLSHRVAAVMIENVGAE